jgi:hypothetical protein
MQSCNGDRRRRVRIRGIDIPAAVALHKTDVMALVILVLLGLVVIGAFFAYLVWWLVDRDSHRHGRD